MVSALLRRILLFISLACVPTTQAGDVEAFVAKHCLGCHDAATASGRFDLSAKALAPSAWIKAYDRVATGEMPPKKSEQPAGDERSRFTTALAASLRADELKRYALEGRATQRRLNRHEYENALRDLLDAPWLMLKDMLPEDAVAHGFNKLGGALDVSHIQMARYLEAADKALHAVVWRELQPTPSKTVRYYARDQMSFTRRMSFSPLNQAAERATFPVLGSGPQPLVRAGKAPMTVGLGHPDRELEGVGLVSGACEPVEVKFNEFKAPVPGHYKLRFNALSVWVGPNGAQSSKNLKRDWFIPDLDSIGPGRRSEPVAVYTEIPPRQFRRLGAFDATPEAAVHELAVVLLAGETIRPDAARLFRSRPGEVRWQNPLAERDGQPAVVYRWMEVEGPLPLPRALGIFDGLQAAVKAAPAEQTVAASRLLATFARRAYRRPVDDREAVRFLPVIEARRAAGATFVEAMIAGYTAVLCSPEFLTVRETPGVLDDNALATRLALFLGNSEPDAELRRLAARGELHQPAILKAQTQRLLDDPKLQRFVDAFLDYWLDLRKAGANAPDATLYNDYYLDDLLADSALLETQAFFAELVKHDLPARNLIDSDFAMLNERLGVHYGIPGVSGVAMRKVPLPADSVRGGVLTQASVLTVTANGTTTSPVLRGAWIQERILGRPSPPPPPVPAVEPDLRGRVTIREQLATHRDQASCAVCHNQIDPPGFALESFDVMGGWRTRYRALSEKDRVPGSGKNGQPFAFRQGLPVDSRGVLPDGRAFQDIREFKKHLLDEEPQVARNLLRQLAVYATGAPVGFSDRAVIEGILDSAPDHRVATMIHALVQSELFLRK